MYRYTKGDPHEKNIITAGFLSAVLACSAQFAITAHADAMPYEPVFEAAPITEALTPNSTVEPVKTASTTPAVTKIAPAAQSSVSTPANTVNSVEANNLQNALMQLDGAQVEIRNQLLQYKSEYSNIDNQYRVIKEQRAQKAKQIKETEKKIKNLDATKEKIRKNLN